jgi:hypothetical protein
MIDDKVVMVVEVIGYMFKLLCELRLVGHQGSL